MQYIKQKKRCGLFLEMGLGKTAITLTAIEELMFEKLGGARVLIIAAKRVALHTWPDEVQRCRATSPSYASQRGSWFGEKQAGTHRTN